MTGNEGWSRADWARWFVHRDEVDEAARVLEPGDGVPLGPSDGLNLAAALERRGLLGTYDEELRCLVVAPRTEGTRKPPARAPGLPAAAPAKRTA
jgi:hypothetical protein